MIKKGWGPLLYSMVIQMVLISGHRSGHQVLSIQEYFNNTAGNKEVVSGEILKVLDCHWAQSGFSEFSMQIFVEGSYSKANSYSKNTSQEKLLRSTSLSSVRERKSYVAENKV